MKFIIKILLCVFVAVCLVPVLMALVWWDLARTILGFKKKEEIKFSFEE